MKNIKITDKTTGDSVDVKGKEAVIKPLICATEEFLTNSKLADMPLEDNIDTLTLDSNLSYSVKDSSGDYVDSIKIATFHNFYNKTIMDLVYDVTEEELMLVPVVSNVLGKGSGITIELGYSIIGNTAIDNTLEPLATVDRKETTSFNKDKLTSFIPDVTINYVPGGKYTNKDRALYSRVKAGETSVYCNSIPLAIVVGISKEFLKERVNMGVLFPKDEYENICKYINVDTTKLKEDTKVFFYL